MDVSTTVVGNRDDCDKFQCTSTDAGATDPTPKFHRYIVCVSGSLCPRKGKNKDKGENGANQKKQHHSIRDRGRAISGSLLSRIFFLSPVSNLGELEISSGNQSLPDPLSFRSMSL